MSSGGRCRARRRTRPASPPPSPTLPQSGEPLLVCGNGTKLGMLRPVQAARSLSARNLTGITLHAPKELVISARAGTTLSGSGGDRRRRTAST